MTASTSRRVRRPDSLATSVVAVLNEFQSPVPTDAMRVIVNDRGRNVTAEHLGRLAAYERQDYLRTFMPPRLCSVVDKDANAITPRWWALADWRLQRRIMTDDIKPIWFASLATILCRELADRTEAPGSPLVTLALGNAARVLGGQHFDLPMSRDEWLALHQRVYAPYTGALNNRGGATPQQRNAEAGLTASEASAVDLYFGRRSS